MVTITDLWVKQHIPKRAAAAHKGAFGTLTILAGSSRYRGAALLATSAALRAGAGIVRLASTEKVCAAAACRLPCCTFLPLPEGEDGGIGAQGMELVHKVPSSAILAGCGMQNTAATAALTKALLQGAAQPLVLDADALNALAGDLQTGYDEPLKLEMLALLKATGSPVVITPHIGEMARLCGLAPAMVQKEQTQTALAFARQYRCTVVLKSARTAIATPEGEVFTWEQSNPGLAKGGSGDVLAGIIAALLAQGLPAATSAAAGVWLHARTGLLAAQAMGQAGLSPADLPHYLGHVWRELGR